jgi:hypothetical protein
MSARHAVALHELRANFEPLLWRDTTHRALKQVWFAGAHADVGGGYSLSESGLSDLALKWMAREVAAQGLRLDNSSPWLTPSESDANVHHEIRGMFLASFPKVRKWLSEMRTCPKSACYVHESVGARISGASRPEYSAFLPCVRSALREVDKATARMLVLSMVNGQGVIK